jgi:hypothetical protein
MTEPTEPKKAGRPAKHGVAMTPKRRAYEYRQRRREAASVVTDDLNAASTQALLDGLAKRLATLEDPATTPEIADTARWVSGNIIAELVKRHAIELPREAEKGAGW